jgi:hypothetical protein
VTLTDKAVTKFWSKVDRSGERECWPWTAGTYRSGYGQFSYRDGETVTSRRAHKLAFELLRGRVPDELTLDHVCGNVICCNPWHLEIVTNRVNQLRTRDMDWDAALGRIDAMPHPVVYQADAAKLLGYSGTGQMASLRQRGGLGCFTLGPRSRVYAHFHLRAFAETRRQEMLGK